MEKNGQNETIRTIGQFKKHGNSYYILILDKNNLKKLDLKENDFLDLEISKSIKETK